MDSVLRHMLGTTEVEQGDDGGLTISYTSHVDDLCDAVGIPRTGHWSHTFQLAGLLEGEVVACSDEETPPTVDTLATSIAECQGWPAIEVLRLLEAGTVTHMSAVHVPGGDV